MKREIERADQILASIADSYRRMATNDAPMYRATQMQKCRHWLDELTEIMKHTPDIWNAVSE